MGGAGAMAAAGGAGLVAEALEAVRGRVAAASSGKGASAAPRLVAVGKTKPVGLLQEAYAAGQRVFGENYAQELIEKAPQMPDDVRWHFIGHLQSNKARGLVAGVPNLTCVETLDSKKLANKLDTACAESQRTEPLSVMLQVNTSGEESKFGLPPGEDCLDLARHVVEACPQLRLAGLMTIGKPDYTSEPENFLCLARCRDALYSALGLPAGSLELSMGMSGDFEQAIEMGSDNVRVGSTIFGAREYPNKK